MNKKQVCLNNESIAYYSACGGIEIKKIEYGIDDYVYCVSNAWNSKKRYHKVKIYYNGDNNYFMVRGYKIPLDECIRM